MLRSVLIHPTIKSEHVVICLGDTQRREGPTIEFRSLRNHVSVMRPFGHHAVKRVW